MSRERSTGLKTQDVFVRPVFKCPKRHFYSGSKYASCPIKLLHLCISSCFPRKHVFFPKFCTQPKRVPVCASVCADSSSLAAPQAKASAHWKSLLRQIDLSWLLVCGGASVAQYIVSVVCLCSTNSLFSATRHLPATSQTSLLLLLSWVGYRGLRCLQRRESWDSAAGRCASVRPGVENLGGGQEVPRRSLSLRQPQGGYSCTHVDVGSASGANVATSQALRQQRSG